jgi:hypothetical protein
MMSAETHVGGWIVEVAATLECLAQAGGAQRWEQVAC